MVFMIDISLPASFTFYIDCKTVRAITNPTVVRDARGEHIFFQMETVLKNCYVSTFRKIVAISVNSLYNIQTSLILACLKEKTFVGFLLNGSKVIRFWKDINFEEFPYRLLFGLYTVSMFYTMF